LSATSLKELNNNFGLKHKVFEPYEFFLTPQVISYLFAWGFDSIISFFPTVLSVPFGDVLEPFLLASFSPTFLVLLLFLSNSSLFWLSGALGSSSPPSPGASDIVTSEGIACSPFHYKSQSEELILNFKIPSI
jgi:hypothetical protein